MEWNSYIFYVHFSGADMEKIPYEWMSLSNIRYTYFSATNKSSK